MTAVIDTAIGGPRWGAEFSPAQWAPVRETPDLLRVFRDSRRSTFDEPPEPRATVDDLIAWAMRQDFEPDHVERLRLDAWGAAGSE